MLNESPRASERSDAIFHLSRLPHRSLLTLPVLLVAVLLPQTANACACGCGIFDVGANVLAGMPSESGAGVSVWFRYSYMNQNQNWEGNSKAPGSDNGDKDINTSFYTVGGEYRVDSDWTVMAELPIYARHLTTTDDGSVTGVPNSVYTGKLTALGDLQLSASYTGLSPDQSSGLMFGVKLPTGDYTGPTGPKGGLEFDRDSLPGTGSTDLMIGGYHLGQFAPDSLFGYFVQARYQAAVLTSSNADGSYRPGNEFDGAAGLTYDFGVQGPFADVLPLVQFLSSWRLHDTGTGADTLNSGYRRVLIAPGIEVRLDNWRFYADVEKPIYQDTNSASSLAQEGTAGQLVAATLYKVQLSYDF